MWILNRVRLSVVFLVGAAFFTFALIATAGPGPQGAHRLVPLIALLVLGCVRGAVQPKRFGPEYSAIALFLALTAALWQVSFRFGGWDAHPITSMFFGAGGLVLFLNARIGSGTSDDPNWEFLVPVVVVQFAWCLWMRAELKECFAFAAWTALWCGPWSWKRAGTVESWLGLRDVRDPVSRQGAFDDAAEELRGGGE